MSSSSPFRRFRRSQQQQQDQIPPPSAQSSLANKRSASNTFGRLLNRNDRRANSNRSEGQPPLATFDACIQAADAIAASPPAIERAESTSTVDTNCSASMATSKKASIADCSVLVSPDGALLFTANNIGDRRLNLEEGDEPYGWTNWEKAEDDVIFDEEYKSAVVLGNDLTANGDFDSNGFTARGWNHDACSSALSASRDVLGIMETFLENIAAAKKQESEEVLNATSKMKECQQRLMSTSYSKQRLGPLLNAGTNLAIAMESVEEYYTDVAEYSAEQWRIANTNLHASTLCSACEVGEDLSLSEQVEKQEQLFCVQGMLPKLKEATVKATSRVHERERAMDDIRTFVSDAQSILVRQKNWAANQWRQVEEEEANIDRLYAIKKLQQHEYYEEQKMKQEARLLGEIRTEPNLTDEVWQMVNEVNSMEDFGHTGYSPNTSRKASISKELKMNNRKEAGVSQEQPPKKIIRADIEKESQVGDMRMIAQAADEAVEDASSKLLNIMSKGDTTLRSSRLAAETCLLSECNAAHSCLKSIVALERASLEERLKKLEVLETAVDTIDVRRDIDNYIRNDKLMPGGRSKFGSDDDGGIAAALATLNSHERNHVPESSLPRIYQPDFFEGWSEEDEGAVDVEQLDELEPRVVKETIELLFSEEGEEITSDGGESMPPPIKLLCRALSLKKRGSAYRQALLYELNSQRSRTTLVKRKSSFKLLCDIFNSFLEGCGHEAKDVKMLMILSQTFYRIREKGEDSDDSDNDSSDEGHERSGRLYVKSSLTHHDVWRTDSFWDEALGQCVSEALTKSGVLSSYSNDSNAGREVKNGTDLKWHDLDPHEYAGVASQVHSVVFAQLGTLSHSMLEMDIGVKTACSFVRRISVRYQLPLSLRITLIQHLIRKTEPQNNA
mmetsp:Transcript_29225/g.69586  ORF Transcript_29225/g.69586 Transcript_29225/m.69586 type:complete len:902 (+) Transcript_29225:312-3017(+)